MKYLQAFFVFAALFLFQSCSSDNIKSDNSLKKYFDEYKVDGSFALYDNGRGEVKVYNLEKDTTRTVPASTFKIVNALVALQTGVMINDSAVIKWDSVTRSNPNWNKDLMLVEAFRYSAVPHFQEIARRIGKDSLQKWVDTLKYGNMKIGPRVDSFWLDNSLLVSPDEELGLVKQLYFDKLPFTKGAQQAVRNMMLQEDNSNYKLSYKTGLGTDKNGHTIGWVVGWIEENKHPYFFVLNIDAVNPGADIAETRLKILNNILKDLGFFEGKM